MKFILNFQDFLSNKNYFIDILGKKLGKHKHLNLLKIAQKKISRQLYHLLQMVIKSFIENFKSLRLFF
jgi:hypothetical protein